MLSRLVQSAVVEFVECLSPEFVGPRSLISGSSLRSTPATLWHESVLKLLLIKLRVPSVGLTPELEDIHFRPVIRKDVDKFTPRVLLQGISPIRLGRKPIPFDSAREVRSLHNTVVDASFHEHAAACIVRKLLHG